jgi:cytoskeletal protein CcmA (bactofilin family)
MSEKVDRTAEAGTLYIGEGVTIKGAVVVCNTVVVDGLIEGDIDVENLSVRKTGLVIGRVRVARNAEIAGKVLEKIEVKGLLVLRAGGRVEGNTSFGTLTMERGASITGEVSSVDYRANLQSTYRANQPLAPPAPKQEQDNRPASAAGAAPAAAAAAAALKRPDLSALDEMPGPFAATA